MSLAHICYFHFWRSKISTPMTSIVRSVKKHVLRYLHLQLCQFHVSSGAVLVACFLSSLKVLWPAALWLQNNWFSIAFEQQCWHKSADHLKIKARHPKFSCDLPDFFFTNLKKIFENQSREFKNCPNNKVLSLVEKFGKI